MDRLLIAALALCLFIATPLAAQIDAEQTIKEGIAAYDAGDYDEAVAKFKAVLAQDPKNELAAYELGLTLHTKGEYAQCRSHLEPWSGKKGKLQAAFLAILGNCTDLSGDSDGAVKTYRKGLKVKPNDAQLLYNLSLTLYTRGEHDEARKLLKKELSEVRPDHASARILLAKIFDEQGFRSAAVVEYFRFLAYEPTGERAKEAARRVLELLSLGVEKKDAANISITIDSKPRKEEGDYSTLEMMMALAASGRHLPPEESEKKDLSEFEQTRAQIASTLAMLAEMGSNGRDYTAKFNVPFFVEMHEKKVLDVFAATTILSLDLPGEQEWAKANADAVEAYLAFRRGEK